MARQPAAVQDPLGASLDQRAFMVVDKDEKETTPLNRPCNPPAKMHNAPCIRRTAPKEP
jgi:hypothetical protein